MVRKFLSFSSKNKSTHLLYGSTMYQDVMLDYNIHEEFVIIL